jgi:hypothetical protein
MSPFELIEKLETLKECERLLKTFGKDKSRLETDITKLKRKIRKSLDRIAEIREKMEEVNQMLSATPKILSHVVVDRRTEKKYKVVEIRKKLELRQLERQLQKFPPTLLVELQHQLDLLEAESGIVTKGLEAVQKRKGDLEKLQNTGAG